MRTRNAFAILLGVNVISFGVGGWLTGFRRAETIRPTPVARAPQSDHSKPLENQGRPATSFNWRQVESADYRSYIANLRSIGCPEETIRDIVIADVTKLYATRKKALLNDGPWKYWLPAQPDGSHLSRSRQKQFEALELERHQLLTTLLGSQAEEDLASIELGEAANRLDFLPPEKRAEILRLETRFRLQRQAVCKDAEDYGSTPDWKQLKNLHGQREAELVRLLSPGELFEYQLRNDEVSEQLRRRLIGFEPTEAEFRELFRLRKAHDQKFGIMDPLDFAAHADEYSDRMSAEAQIKAFLGEARYQEMRRSADSRFGELYRLTQQFDLPVNTAAALYDRHLQMQNEITRIQKDPALDPAQRDQALRGFQDEMDMLLRQSLGETAYARFQARGIQAFLGN